jgi:hypothetical protein
MASTDKSGVQSTGTTKPIAKQQNATFSGTIM